MRKWCINELFSIRSKKFGTRFKIGCDWKSFSVGSIDEVVVAVVVVAVVGVLGLGLVLMLADEVLLENNFKLVEL